MERWFRLSLLLGQLLHLVNKTGVDIPVRKHFRRNQCNAVQNVLLFDYNKRPAGTFRLQHEKLQNKNSMATPSYLIIH